MYVANLGPDVLYLGDGRGKFSRAMDAGIKGSHWSSCAAFVDYDRDGDLDLYVTHYVINDPSRVCRLRAEGERDYCGPSWYRSVPDVLYQNQGSGRFADVTKQAGLRGARSGFGVVCLDFTGDGWVDIFVANDQQPNTLWVNQKDGTFVDEGLFRGVAVNGHGSVEASMGIAPGDVDGDQHLDLFLTHLVDQTNTLYTLGGAPGDFDDRSARSGLGAPSLQLTGWGCGFADFDLDGDLDVATANGRIARGSVYPEARVKGFWSAYAEPNLLFGNENGQFKPVRDGPRGFTGRADVSRALAFGDLDRDGRIDLVETTIGNGLRVYQNRTGKSGRHWIAVRAVTANRDALGASVAIEAAGRKQVRPVLSAYSFQSASEPVAHFGLGTDETVKGIEIRWPDGKAEQFRSAASRPHRHPQAGYGAIRVRSASTRRATSGETVASSWPGATPKRSSRD